MSLVFVPRTVTPTNAVSIAFNVYRNSGSTGTIYSGIRFGADGNLYERQVNGGLSRFSTWLYNGSSGDYYVSRVIDSGSLTTDAGAGPLIMSTDRDYDVQLAFDGEAFCNITFSISDDVSGSPVVASRSCSFFAERGFL